MVALHRGIGPLFILPAEEAPRNTSASVWPALQSLQDSAASVRTTEELSRQNPPSEPSASCAFQVALPRPLQFICVTSEGALLERGRRVLRLLV